MQRGQALTEYVILIAIIAGLVSLVGGYMPRVMNRIEKPLREDFRKAYRYGDPKACGKGDTLPGCDGQPQHHPRVRAPENFKLFGRGLQ